jgi:hypothetical protein
MARHDQLAYGGWHQANSVLVNLDFSGDADTHDYDPPKGGAVVRAVSHRFWQRQRGRDLQKR